MDTKEKIKQTIMTSVFLDENRKKKLLEILKIATQAEQEKLMEALKSEKGIIGEIIHGYIASKGEDAVASLDLLFSKGQKSILVATEKKDQKQEEGRMENLLEALENIKI